VLTAKNVPVGGAAAFGESSPQQTTAPFVRNAQAKLPPTLTEEKLPDGGDGIEA
jgi:hypothetical protein